MSSDARPPEGENQYPQAFGRYVLVERLAIGGMAEIFKAKVSGAAGFEKTLVLKRILPHLAADRQFVDMFIDEAKLTVHLVHPKIVQVFEFGEVAGQYFLAMEYVDGLDALALLRVCAQKKVALPLALAVHVSAEVLDALDYAHNATDPESKNLGIVHRDISPSNVFIARRGDIKLGDFGIAHATERQSKTQAGTLKGKYGYMSPEQVVGGTLDSRTDIFAVGIVLSEMLMGRRLFTAPNDLDVLLMVRDVKLERLERFGPHIPPTLRMILNKALARSLEERFQTAGEFRDALNDWLDAARTRVRASDVADFCKAIHEGRAPPETFGRVSPASDVAVKPAPPAPQVVQEVAPPAAPILRPAPAPAPPRVVPLAGPPLVEIDLSLDDIPDLLVAPPSRQALPPRSASVAPQPVPQQVPPPRPAVAAPTPAPPPRPVAAPPAPDRPAPVAPAPLPPVDSLASAPKTSTSARPPVPTPTRAAPNPTMELDVEVVLEGGVTAPDGSGPSDTLSSAVDAGSFSPARTVEQSQAVPIPSPAVQPRDRPAARPLEARPLENIDLDVHSQVSAAPPFLAPGTRAGAPAAADLSAPSSSVALRQLHVEEARPGKAPDPAGSGREIALAPFVPPAPTEPPTEVGELLKVTPVRLLTRLASGRKTGLVRFTYGPIVKDVFLVDGAPEYVTSNLARELFGEYLVAHKVITESELAMSLAMMPRFNSKLGDTLVGLGLLRPLDVFRHLTRQVRDKLVDVFSWIGGQYAYHEGKTNSREAFPLGLDAFEIIGAGVLTVALRTLEKRFSELAQRTPRRIENPPVQPEVFKLGPMPRELYVRLDGRRSVGDWVTRYRSVDERLAFCRTLYLLIEAGLAEVG